jgi:hypothetical protein
MGILGDKMLAAGVVSQDDADRLHRQETIKKEQQRKERERKFHQEKARDLEDRLEYMAKTAAALFVKDIALEFLGFTEEERGSLLTKNPPPSLELFHKLGCLSHEVMVLTSSEIFRKTIQEEKDRLLKDQSFRKYASDLLRKFPVVSFEGRDFQQFKKEKPHERV